MNNKLGLSDGFKFGLGLLAAIVILCTCACFGTCSITAILSASLPAKKSPAVADRPSRTRSAVSFNQVQEGEPEAVTQTPDPRPTPKPTPTATPSSRAQGTMNQDLMVGEIRWKFLEAVDLGQKLPAKDYHKEMTTSGKFIKVRFEVENRSGRTLNFSYINLIDSKGRSFRDNFDAKYSQINENERCPLEQLNPNLSKTCGQVFEVPADATNLKALVGDLEMLSDKEGLIDLGLK